MRGGRGGRGALMFACLSRLDTDRASLGEWSFVPIRAIFVVNRSLRRCKMNVTQKGITYTIYRGGGMIAK